MGCKHVLLYCVFVIFFFRVICASPERHDASSAAGADSERRVLTLKTEKTQNEVRKKMPRMDASSTTRQRSLEQAAWYDSEDPETGYTCNLPPVQTWRYRGGDPQTWRIDDEALKDVDNDLQSIVNCTEEGDVLLFNVTKVVQPASAVYLQRNLTLGTDPVSDAGAEPEAATTQRTRFRCPPGEGIFRIGSGASVDLRNLEFRDCRFGADATAKGAIEVDVCEDAASRSVVTMHDVAFKKNHFVGAAALLTRSPSCTEVELLDFVFAENVYAGTGVVLLSTNTTIIDAKIQKNRVYRSAKVQEAAPVIFKAEASAQGTEEPQIVAENLRVVRNEGISLCITGGSLDLKNATFVRNGFSPSEANKPADGCLRLTDVVASVENCTFRGNTGRTGPGLYVKRSNVTLSNSNFERNAATASGVLSFREKSTVEAHGCVFVQNTAELKGGVAFISDSSFAGTGLTFSNNSAVRGGGSILLEDSSLLRLTESQMSRNEAGTGGFLMAQPGSRLFFEDCQFEANEAQSTAGAVYLQDSQIHCQNCSMSLSTAQRGGFFAAFNSSVAIVDSTMRIGHGSVSGGCIYAVGNSTVELRNASLAECSAGSSGGGILSRNSLIKVRQTNFSRNRAAEFGGCVSGRDFSILDVRTSHFIQSQAAKGGTLHVMTSSNASLTDCDFSSSEADNNGGFCVIEGNSSAIFNGGSFVNSTSRSGGAMHVRSKSRLELRQSSMRNSSSRDGGFLFVERESHVEIQSTILENGKARENGGSICLEESSIAVISDVEILSSNASEDGGAIYSSNSRLEVDNLLIKDSVAGLDGGAILLKKSSQAVISSSSFSGNSADDGGAIELENGVYAKFRKVEFQHNQARSKGGAVCVTESDVEFVQVSMEGCVAEHGACLHVYSSSAEIRGSKFFNGSAYGDGGFILASKDSVVRAWDSLMTNGNATAGGAATFRSSTLIARALIIRRCNATSHGGGIEAGGTSKLLCSGCDLEANVAQTKGGAVYFRPRPSNSSAIQLHNTTVRSNRADIGGAVYLARTEDGEESTSGAASGPFAFFTDTTFEHNAAKRVGGAIFFNDLDDVRVACATEFSNSWKKFYTEQEWKQMKSLKDLEEACPSWTGNTAEWYGDRAASYAQHVLKTIDFERPNEDRIVEGNKFTLEDHRSGDAIPAINLEVLDALGQRGSLGEENDNITAVMTSPSPSFFNGIITLPLERGQGSFTGITGFREEGEYRVQIKFTGAHLEMFELTVKIRGCRIGEEATDGLYCQTCSGATYRFEETERCVPCPENGNCTTQVILPIKGYWQKTPCSTHLEKCLTRTACASSERDHELAEAVKDVQSCDFEEIFLETYADAQCKEGHRGPLCASCDRGHGRHKTFACSRCPTGLGNAGLVLAALLILLGLTSFTVYSNLKSSRRHFYNVRPGHQHSLSANSANSTTTLCPGRPRGPPSASSGTGGHSHSRSPDQLDKEAELAKWKAAEVFKITVNFAQVTAVAMAMNVEWTDTIRGFLEGIEYVSGVTSEAINLSIDCIASDNAAVDRSVMSTYIDILVPLGVILIFALFWSTVKIRRRKGWRYLIERSVLSSIAVAYIAYIGVTKTLIQILNCITVHDSVTREDAKGTSYWALDTSIKCYEGSHTILAAFLGWPLLFIFSFGFPVTMAYVIVRNVQLDYKDGWIYNVSGFLYRAYRRKFVYWESVIMLRKAVLDVAVVLTFPSGGNIQAVLAVLVLAIALYFQTLCRPYREEFNRLNELESVSVLVSLVTFVSSLFFHEENLPYLATVLLSILILFLNTMALVTLLIFFSMYGSEFLRLKLDSEGVSYDPTRGAWHVVWVYVSRHLYQTAKAKVVDFAALSTKGWSFRYGTSAQ